MAMPITSFPLFASFPPEIHYLILENCSPNDQICLRLTCKYLYNHTPSPKGGMSLDNIDAGPLCDVGSCASLGYGHRQECHKKSYEVYCERNKRLGRSCPEMKKCKTSWISFHCECYTRRTKLHFRLRTWMPKGLNYCGRCGKFTKRKKQHNGRCYHGVPKERKCVRRYWTHTRGRSYGEKLWKKWFNNRAMNRLERRLEYPLPQRNGSARYALRTLEPKIVDSREIRDSRAGVF